MATTQASQLHGAVAQFTITINGVDIKNINEVTPVEVILGESLLNPGLQTSVRVHSHVHSIPVKNLDDYKGAVLGISIKRDVLKEFGLPHTMEVSQRLYRMDMRKPIAQSIEEFVIHACDDTLLRDAEKLVSKSWKCTTPSQVVREVLSGCVQPRNLMVESTSPARDYIAENIHPFQVVNQQANAALAAGNDPSLLHYMTYHNLGTHWFYSLHYLTRKSPVMRFGYTEVGAEAGYANPYGIMTHSFPCDFDLLSDILNGIGPNGVDINSLMVFNPVMKTFSLLGNQALGCGMGGGNIKTSVSNSGSAQQQNMCPDYTELWLLKRQARMAMLEQDKIALRLTVPWNPILHAGETIELDLYNRKETTSKNYGSGKYLIVSMTHNLKLGGFSTTTMDCVSHTVGTSHTV